MADEIEIGSKAIKQIQQLRDEAHRFGITFHRSLRSKKQTISELDLIKGIGEKTKVVLLKQYKSVKRIREASQEELRQLIGVAKTNVLLEGLKIIKEK